MRVIVNGAAGKMGLLACETFEKHPEFTLVARLTKEDDLSQAMIATKAQIVVDLTRADCVYENSKKIINHNVHPVIGTSGLIPAQIQELTALCASKRLGGVIAPNFSIGAILMMLCAAKVAVHLSEVEIIEMHHQQKIDAPSGTAFKTAEMIADARRNTTGKPDREELFSESRGAVHKEVRIHALRLPGVIARQDVIFGSVGETLSITHNSIDRQCFMPGILLACQKVVELDTLVYGLEHLLAAGKGEIF